MCRSNVGLGRVESDGMLEISLLAKSRLFFLYQPTKTYLSLLRIHSSEQPTQFNLSPILYMHRE